MSDQQLAEEWHELIIRKFKKRKIQSLFIDNIQVADLADMRLIIKFKKGIRFLLCVANVYSSCEWVITLKDKKSFKITNAFQNILKESNRKPNKVWVYKGSGFDNESMKSWLEKNGHRNVFHA